MRAFFLSPILLRKQNWKCKDAVDQHLHIFFSFFLLFLLFLFFMCVLLRQGEGNTIDSYSKQHSPSEALFQPSPGKISGLLEF